MLWQNLKRWWKASPARGLQFYLAVHLALSFAYMYYFCRYNGFSRILAVIHLSALTGPLLVLVVGTGLIAVFGRNHGRVLAKYLVAGIYAFWSTALALLYLAHFIGNRLWGNNVNYELISRYLLRSPLATDDGLSLSRSSYVSLGIAAAFAIVAHVFLSGSLVKGLVYLFGPERPSGPFHGRTRAYATCLVIVLALSTYGVYVYSLPRYASNWNVELEPITSFFHLDAYDTRHNALVDRLRVTEPRARASYPTGQNFVAKNVIIVIVDALRADRMQVYGYGRPTTPFLNGLVQSGQAAKVDLATATCAESNCGILSTLSSKTLPAIIPEDFKIHDLLNDQGYKSYFLLSGDHDWFGLKKGYGPGITYYADNTTSERYRGLADDRSVLEALENVPDFDGTPAFFFVHLMSVHVAGVKQDRYTTYQPANVDRNWDTFVHGAYDPVSLSNNYDNGVTQADAMIEQIFERLRDKGYLSQSVGAILSDHGEALGERGPLYFGHIKWLYQECLRIPLLFFDADGASLADGGYATQIDVAPTIVDRIGLQVPSSWQGQSLLRPSSRQYTFHQTTVINPTYSVMARTPTTFYQYIHQVQTRTEELYDLHRDPKQTRNLISTGDTALIRELRTQLDQYRNQR